MKQLIQIALILLCLSLWAPRQMNAQNSGGKPPDHPAEPTITFDRYWEAATPQEFVIQVKSTGEASYLSRNPTRIEKGADGPDPDYTFEFTMPSGDCDRLFSEAKEAGYFQASPESKHKVADTGKKTLSYADPVRNFQSTYNFSENKSVEWMTDLFQGISGTLEHARKLEFLRRFDKLGLDDELKGMEEMAQNGYLTELQLIAPLLQNLSNDYSVMHIARDRAKRLLDKANGAQK